MQRRIAEPYVSQFGPLAREGDTLILPFTITGPRPAADPRPVAPEGGGAQGSPARSTAT